MSATEHSYQYTTVEYSHPKPRYRSRKRVSVRIQMDYDEIVAGASINLAENNDQSDEI